MKSLGLIALLLAGCANYDETQETIAPYPVFHHSPMDQAIRPPTDSNAQPIESEIAPRPR